VNFVDYFYLSGKTFTMNCKTTLSTLLFSLFLHASLFAQQTELVYLSGTGFDQTVEWDFYCSDGMNSKAWTTIEVPSCWEQQGFGQYNYGHVPFDQRLKEEGHYRYRFQAKKAWKGKHIELVFEGVMTDARVLVNGKQVGQVHQGAFYRFSYDISRLVKYGKDNTLEVMVKKFSDNETVNQAERKADYWVFGGIFRPVYLEVKPKNHIRRVAIDARADGNFTSDVYLSGINADGKVKVEILDRSGHQAGVFEARSHEEGKPTRVRGKLDQVLTWTPEYPHLYTARFQLLDQNGSVLHQLSETLGFRTVEVREQDGIYLNNVRIKYKGVCRHTFHPDHGRTSSKAFSIEVVNLLKGMNMNAVRMSHYPPDRHFLDVCDSLGLLVLDELAGWQRPPYDSVVGRKLLREMIARDVNHPSVVMWDNANEGGWNTAYDRDFKELDIQQREVTHPWGVFEKTNTAHYVNYDYLAGDHFAPRSIFFPTEMIHGLYDGGLGAGLEDFWLRMWNDPLSAGGFLWVFADEAIKRTDTGELDSDGNHAPDGILGPYHEKEASFYTIREIWAPVFFEKRYITPEFNGKFRIQNRFHYTSLDQCTFRYHWIHLPGPEGSGMTDPDALAMGDILDFGVPGVDPLEPGQAGWLQVPIKEGWQRANVLYLEAKDPHGRLIHRWSWPVKSPNTLAAEWMETDPGMQVTVSEDERTLMLSSGAVTIALDKHTGLLKGVLSGGRNIPLSQGPVFRDGHPDLKEFKHLAIGRSHHVVVDYGRNGRLIWAMHAGGLVDMKLDYQPDGGRIPFTGASFAYPEAGLKSVKYLGRGPYRVWKNRMKGVNFNVWEKSYNNTITGHSGYDYPEFKGYYANLYWAVFKDRQNHQFKVFSRTEDLFLRLFTPQEAPDPARTALQHPAGDISFMLGIPAIGTKFKEAEELGPRSGPYHYDPRRVADAALHIELTFDFR
jgi:hypothetical protein